MNVFEKNNRQIITVIDIGTTKISVLTSQITSDGNILIKGIGRAPCEGLKKGVVVDIAKTVYALSNAVAEAEIMSNSRIEQAIIGVSGSHIHAHNSSGVVPIKTGTISTTDICNALAAAQAIALDEGQQILHVLPRYFRIDSKDIVYDPLGMHGIRLEVEAHIITGATNSIKNLISCCEQANIQVTDIILEQIASAHAVLSNDERMLGALVIDIGGGTSDIALYHNNALYYTKVIPIAGNQFTHDLAIGLRTTHKTAEMIKKDYGVVYPSLIDEQKLIEIEQVQENDRQVVIQPQLYHILMPRAVELLKIIKKEIETNHLEQSMSTGIVLTGGGSLLQGMQELTEYMFKVPVRIGKPHIQFALPHTINSPIFATGYGMLVYTAHKQHSELAQKTKFNQKKIFERMKNWITGLF
jgi:cell division protein FtsA